MWIDAFRTRVPPAPPKLVAAPQPLLNPARLREIADAIESGSLDVKSFRQSFTDGDDVRIVRLNLTLMEKLSLCGGVERPELDSANPRRK